MRIILCPNGREFLVSWTGLGQGTGRSAENVRRLIQSLNAEMDDEELQKATDELLLGQSMPIEVLRGHCSNAELFACALKGEIAECVLCGKRVGGCKSTISHDLGE
jgi:hypothetical protein